MAKSFILNLIRRRKCRELSGGGYWWCYYPVDYYKKTMNSDLTGGGAQATPAQKKRIVQNLSEYAIKHGLLPPFTRAIAAGCWMESCFSAEKCCIGYLYLPTYLRPVARIFFWGGGCVVWRGRGIFARGFLLPLNQYITNSGMIIVFYYRPTQSRLDLNGPL